MPKGELSGSVAAELFVVRATQSSNPGDGEVQETPTKVSPSLPSLMLRLGVAERTDIGFHVYNGAALGMDLKYLLIRGDIDIALAPGGHLHSIPGDEVDYTGQFFQLPLIMDFNASSAVSFVLSPGVAYVHSEREDLSNKNALDGGISYSGTMTRVGLGLNLRGSPGFALHPEATWLHGVSRSEPWDQVLVGLGFTFGTLPSFSD